MVNRATFYRHYEDKYDLLEQYIKELSELIDADEGETSPSSQPLSSLDTPPPGLVKLLRHIQANADFYQVMLGRQGDPVFCAQAFRDCIEQGYRRILSSQAPQSDPSRPPIDLTVSYLLTAGIGAIVWWLESERPASPEQMAIWLYQLSRASISASFGSA